MARVRVQKNFRTLYLVMSTKVPGKRNPTTKVLKNLGRIEDIQSKYSVADAVAWAQEQAAELQASMDAGNGLQEASESIGTAADKLGTDGLRCDNTLSPGERTGYNVGYLFLRKIYYGLKLDQACRYIRRTRHPKMAFSLNDALQLLVYGRCIFPCSNWESVEKSSRFIDMPQELKYQHVMRSLPLLGDDMDYLQRYVYKQSRGLIERDEGLFLFDCTNVWFDIDKPDGPEDIRTFSYNNKSHNGKPCVGMGMVVDGNGVPALIDVFRGCTNEQCGTKSMVDKLRWMGLKDFTMCMDAGLASLSNRNHLRGDGITYVAVLPLKQMDAEEESWCLQPEGWSYFGQGGTEPVEVTGVNLGELDEKKDYDKVFVKERICTRKLTVTRRVITRESDGKVLSDTERTKKNKLTKKEKARMDEIGALYASGRTDEARQKAKPEVTTKREEEILKEGEHAGCKMVTTRTTYLFEEKVTVTYSMKYRDFLRERREGNVKRAEEKISENRCEEKGVGSSRYIRTSAVSGEAGGKASVQYSLNKELIEADEKIEGFYAIATSDFLYDKQRVVKDNSKRWRVENVFRFIKSKLALRPIFVKKKEHIIAHMLVVMLSCTIFYILMNLVNRESETKYTEDDVLDAIRDLGLTKLGGGSSDGYATHCCNSPALERLNTIFANFRIDQRLYDKKELSKIISRSYALSAGNKDYHSDGTAS